MEHLDGTQARILREIATREHGVVTRREALAAGVSRPQLRHRLDNGTLLWVHPGVYRLGHVAPSVEATYLAAVRACGDGALLTARAAAYHFGLIRGPAPPPEVTAPTQRSVDGVLTHRARRPIDARDATVWRAIPVTSVARTLVDLAAVLSVDELARVCHEAGVRHRTTPKHVAAALARCPRARGATKLRRVIHGDVPVSLSVLERRFLALLRDAGLPLPVTNRPAGGRRVDCRWPEHRLTVELDSYRYHSSRHAWEQDRRREREARARGDDFRRFTYGDVFESPGPMLRELRRALLPTRPA